MTEKEAKDIIYMWSMERASDGDVEACEAFDMAIKALEELSLYKQGGLVLIPADVYKRQCDELDAYKIGANDMELRDLIKEHKKCENEYQNRYKQKLIELLEECGLHGVDLIVEGLNIRGVIRIERKAYGEYEYVFYPYNKNGEVSQNSKYIGLFIYGHETDDEIKRKLKSKFKVREKMKGEEHE